MKKNTFSGKHGLNMHKVLGSLSSNSHTYKRQTRAIEKKKEKVKKKTLPTEY